MKKLLLLSLHCLFLFSLNAQQAVAPSTAAVDWEKPNSEDFYATDQVRELRVRIPSANWREALDSLRSNGNGLLTADLQIDGAVYKNIGIRYRGSKSFQTGSKRNAFSLKLNHVDKKQQLQGHQNLKLSNALRDPSMIREVLAYEIARQYMPAPKANFAQLYINDEYYGLFVNIEAIDDAFLNRHYQSDDHTLIKASSDTSDPHPESCKKKIYGSLEYEQNPECYAHNFELKSDAGWDDLIALTKELEQAEAALAEVLNIDRTLWMLAFNNALVNLNSYTGQQSQNYYLYKDDFGRFNPIIWDLNLAFGSFKNTGQGSDLSLKELQNLDPLLHSENPRKPLISALLQNPLYRKTYLAHLRSIVYDQFVSGRYEKRAKELQQLIRVPFSNDPNRYYDLAEFNKSLQSTIGRRSKIPGIMELMEPRARFLKKHPEIAVIPPEVSEVKVMRRKQFSEEAIREFRIQAKVDKLPKRVKLYYRYASGENYQEAYMADDGQSNDGAAGDKVFGVSIAPAAGQEQLEYYILTENARALSFYPPNYMFEPQKVKLAELN